MNPAWIEQRLPTSHECSIASELEKRARAAPDGLFAVFENGDRWTAQVALDLVKITAGRLRSLGVERETLFAVWLPNGPDLLKMLLAASYIGATPCLMNAAWQGSIVTHALALTEVKLLWTNNILAERLGDAETSQMTSVVICGDENDVELAQIQIELEGNVAVSGVEPAIISPWDLAAIVFSSGTTGPSKGVRVTAAQLWMLGKTMYGYAQPNDRMFVVLPMFHIAALGSVYGALINGATLGVADGFTASRFWDIVRQLGVTITCGLGQSFTDLLMKAAPRPDDRDNPLRLSVVQHVNESVAAFSRRFGIDVLPCFNMTETCGIAVSAVNPAPDGSVGRPSEMLEVRLVDEHDIEVPAGERGELIVRSRLPWILNDGYLNNPDATTRAWKNGWFHTGDLFRQNVEGDLFYVDRLKDSIRRRGENISASEIEREVRLFPAIRDVAAIGVGPANDQEVLVVVSSLPDQRFDPSALITFLTPRLPRYMLPRYIRVMDELPKTGTNNKVVKQGLRDQGLGPDCWDRLQ